VWRLARLRANDDPHGPTMRAWLQAQGQSDTAIEQFWTVILVSALGESLDRVSVSAARKVFVDGFLASSEASSLYVPNSPLELIYGQRLLHWLGEHDVEVHLSAAVEHIELGHRPRVVMAGGEAREFDYVVVAVPWRQAAALFDLESRSRLPTLEIASRLQPAPISAVHLWFDRPIMDLPHAVLVGRLSQWIFNHGASPSGTSENRNASTVDKPARGSHYYQVVISASHELCGRDRDAVVAEVIGELATIWPEVATARLVRARLVTEPFSVFSVAPGTEQWRPAQRTHDPRLLLAGDWTATGWPATMEGAVRSGYLAAEALLVQLGRPERIVVPDLVRGWLVRFLMA
jgi:squalene-associated FAD-dependent desaturase